VTAYDFTIRPVNIPDHVVDTEANLNPVVLRKNLYRLGLPYDLFNPTATLLEHALLAQGFVEVQ
jgi:hypothetical protein